MFSTQIKSSHILGVGSTWVMFAGLMKRYDLDVFSLHYKKNQKKQLLPKKLISTPKITYFLVFCFKQ